MLNSSRKSHDENTDIINEQLHDSTDVGPTIILPENAVSISLLAVTTSNFLSFAFRIANYKSEGEHLIFPSRLVLTSPHHQYPALQ